MNEVTIREPAGPEAERIAYLFRDIPLPAATQVLGAVRTHPIERFVGAAACWTEGMNVRFRLACQPGVARNNVASPLIHRIEECARQAGVNTIHYAEALEENNGWSAVLREQGYRPVHSERFFEAALSDAQNRIMQSFAKHKARIPTGWRTESIRQHPAETALPVIADHRLMPPAEVRELWRANSPVSFDPDVSALLFDGAHCKGALLVRKVQDAYCVDVLVVEIENAFLRALGNISLLQHAASRSGDGGDAVRWLRFRAGELEHRETANKAFRMKGRELPTRHVFGKTL